MVSRTILFACCFLLASCTHVEVHRDSGGTRGAPAWVDASLVRADAARCAGAQCTVGVKADGCSPVASPYYLVVTRRNTVIRWVVQDKGYAFDEKDGIQFKKRDGGADPQREFRCSRLNPGTWQCVGSGGASHEAFWYGIKLIAPDGKACVADPIIVNDY